MIVSSPTGWGELFGAATDGALDVRAVGYHIVGAEGSAQIGIVEQWNDTMWSSIESPTPQGVTHPSLVSITTDMTGGYWAAGSYPNGDSIPQALVVRCSWTSLTSSRTRVRRRLDSR